MDNELFVLTIGEESDISCAVFTSSESAVNWFKKLYKKGLPVSIHRVEKDSNKNILLYLQDKNIEM